MKSLIERTQTLAGSLTDVNPAFGALASGGKFRSLNLIDVYAREAVATQVGTSQLSCQICRSDPVTVNSPVGDLVLTHTKDAALS